MEKTIQADDIHEDKESKVLANVHDKISFWNVEDGIVSIEVEDTFDGICTIDFSIEAVEKIAKLAREWRDFSKE